MIFGKTNEEKEKIQQEKLKKEFTKIYKFFTFLPKRLEDGRWAWLEYISALRSNIYSDKNKYYFVSKGRRNKFRYYSKTYFV